MPLPSLAVVIPTKNEEQYLPTVLQALRRQTVQPVEIVVADADSTDATRQIAESFQARVVEGGIPSVGRNNGAKATSAELILFLDADVIIGDDQFIEKALTEMTARTLALATADIYLQQGSKLEHLGHSFYNRYVRLSGIRRPHLPGFCIFVTRQLFDQINGFDPTITFCEDQDFAIRGVRQGRMGFLNSIRIGVTNRRTRRDGAFRVALQLALAELHILVLGPIRHDLFRYHFGYPKPKDQAPSK